MESLLTAPSTFREAILRQQCVLALFRFESMAFFFVFLAVLLNTYPSDCECACMYVCVFVSVSLSECRHLATPGDLIRLPAPIQGESLNASPAAY